MAEPQIPDETHAHLVDVVRCWMWREELVGFARARHGHGNSDGGYGVTFPGDVDPGDPPIPEGFVRIYGWWGENFDELVPEADYLTVLSEVLTAEGYADHAAEAAALAAERR